MKDKLCMLLMKSFIWLDNLLGPDSSTQEIAMKNNNSKKDKLYDTTI